LDTKILLESASKLTQPSQESANEFERKSQIIAQKLTTHMKRRPDLTKLVGKDGVDMMEDNSRNMTRFMGSVFKLFNPKIFVETCCWVFVTYRSHGFQLAFWSANIDTVIEVCKDELSQDCFKEVEPFFNWIITNIPVFTNISEDKMNKTE